jgi:hypothetical protein
MKYYVFRASEFNPEKRNLLHAYRSQGVTIIGLFDQKSDISNIILARLCDIAVTWYKDGQYYFRYRDIVSPQHIDCNELNKHLSFKEFPEIYMPVDLIRLKNELGR